jgi:undecaprenyl-diphosphatase
LNLQEGIFLGIVQGLTEFLPVSSSGHLVLVQSLIKGFRQPGVLFDVILHFGTLLAIVFFLRRDIYDMLKAMLPLKWYQKRGYDYNEDLIVTRRRLVFFILVGTVCTGIIGVMFKDAIHGFFERVEVVALMLLVTGTLLFLSDRIKNTWRGDKDLNIYDSIIIGVVQAAALMPGLSRSGSTIAFGIFRKLDGETAARFSFLLSVPAVAGATFFELKYVSGVSPHDMVIYLAGMVAAVITGFLTLKILFFIIKKRRLSIFALYCWVLGVSTLIIKFVV